MDFDIELRHLETFLVVAEEMNFKRAARRLNIAQPPLSRQIRRLEQDLGVTLFQRTQRRVQLTEAGQALVTEARQILATIEQSIRVVQRANRGEVGKLVVGFEGSSAYEVVPFSLKVYQEQFPSVEVIVHQMTTGQQVQALIEERINVGFLVPLLRDENLMMETVLQEPMILALPENHPLSNQSEIDLQDLANESFIVGPHQQRCGLYEQVIVACRQAGFSPKVVQETEEMQITLGFIAAGLGVALLSASAQNIRRPGVVYRTLTPPIPKMELAIAWRINNQSSILQGFLTVVRAFLSQQ
jgi:DNA-binding transcriptional LysR family regulator